MGLYNEWLGSCHSGGSLMHIRTEAKAFESEGIYRLVGFSMVAPSYAQHREPTWASFSLLNRISKIRSRCHRFIILLNIGCPQCSAH